MFTHASSNRREFQKGLDAEKARAIRHDSQLSLRRKQREAHLQKKVRLLRSSSSSSSFGELKERKAFKKDLGKYIANVMQVDNICLQLNGLHSIRKLLSVDRDPPIKRICLSGILPKIIQFMYGNEDKLSFEAAWTITNICASSTKEYTFKVVEYGGIEAFVWLLRNCNKSNKKEIMSQTIWGLGNICADGNSLRKRILSTGVLKDIILIIDDYKNLNSELQENALWTLSQIVRYQDMDLNNRLIKLKDLKNIKIICILCKLLGNNKLKLKENIIRDCLYTLNYLSNENEEICEFIVKESKTIKIIMKLLNVEVGKYLIALNQSKTGNKKEAILSLNNNIYIPCLRFLGNILSCDDELTQIILEDGYLDLIEPFFNHFLAQQRREIMWSLSNILAGSHQQIECILSRTLLIKSIINCAINDQFRNRIEACFAICNAVNGAIPAQKHLLVKYGAIEAICSLLNPMNKICDSFLLVIIQALDAFLQIFGDDVMNVNPFAERIEECNGLTYLEARSMDETIDENIWHAICNLMDTYWGKENEKEFKFGINPFINNNNENKNPNIINNNQFGANNNSIRFSF